MKFSASSNPNSSQTARIVPEHSLEPYNSCSTQPQTYLPTSEKDSSGSLVHFSQEEQAVVRQTQEYLVHFTQGALSEAWHSCSCMSSGDEVVCQPLDSSETIIYQSFLDQVFQGLHYDIQQALAAQSRCVLLHNIYQESYSKYLYLEHLLTQNSAVSALKKTKLLSMKILLTPRPKMKGWKSSLRTEDFTDEFLIKQLKNLPRLQNEQLRACKLFQEGVKQQKKGRLTQCKQKFLQAAGIQRQCGLKADLLETLRCLGRAFEATGDELAAMTAYFERVAIRDGLDTISRVDKFKALLRNPLVVYGSVSLSEVAERLARVHTDLERHQSYELLLNIVYTRESRTNQLPSASYVYALTQLAVAALARNESLLETICGNNEHSEHVAIALKSSLIVSGSQSQGKSTHQFIHPSVAEYLEAKQIVSEIEAGPSLPTTKTINLHTLTDQAGVRSFIVELTQTDTLLFQEQLLEFVFQSRAESTLATASANAMTLLHQTGYSFAWKDFSGINIPRANLSGADLTGTNLETSQLQGVNLSGCNLAMTRLKRANLANAEFGIYLHNQASTKMCMSADGALVASANNDNTVTLWRTSVSRNPRYLQGDSEELTGVWFSHDNVYIASVSGRQTILVWDAASGRLVRRIHGHSHEVTVICFSPNHLYMAAGSQDCTTILWNVETGKQLRTLQGHSSVVKTLCYSSDGALIASGSSDRCIILWTAATGQKVHVLQGHNCPVTALCFSPNQKLIVSGSSDTQVILWDVVAGKQVDSMNSHRFDITSVSFSHDGAFVGSSGRDLILWEIETGRKTCVIGGFSLWETSVTFTPDGGLIVVCKREQVLMALKPIRTQFSHSDKVSTLSASTDGALVASGSLDTSVLVRETTTGQVLLTLRGHSKGVTAVCFSRDTVLLASGSWIGGVTVWKTRTGQQVSTMQLHSCGVTALSFSANSSCIASASYDGNIAVSDANSGQRMRILETIVWRVTQIFLSDQGTLFACGIEDNRSHIVWETDAGYQLSTLEGHSSMVITACCSPDAKVLASGSRDRQVILWSTTTAQPIHTLNAHNDWVTALCFADDNLISGSRDGQLIVWEVTTGQLIHIVQKYSDRLGALCLVPNQSRVVFGGAETGVVVCAQIRTTPALDEF